MTADGKTLGEMANEACAVLPVGWEVRLCIYRESGWVELIDPDEEMVVFPTNRESIEQEFVDAVNHAIKQEAP